MARLSTKSQLGHLVTDKLRDYQLEMGAISTDSDFFYSTISVKSSNGTGYRTDDAFCFDENLKQIIWQNMR